MNEKIEHAQSDIPGTRRLTTVMAVDVCGYSSLSETDQARAIATVRQIETLIDKLAAELSGHRFHKAGDGFLVEFRSAVNALQAAQGLIQSVEQDPFLQAPTRTEIRIGLHVGEVSEQPDGDLLGHGVNVAARLQHEADPNGILVSAQLMNLVSTHFKGRARRRGRLALRNISEPVEAFDIEASGGVLSRIFSRLKRIFKRHGLVLALFGTVLIAAIAAPLIILNQQEASATLDAKVSSILEESFSDPNTNIDRSTLDTAYMRGVLRHLGESKQPSDRVTFALLEQGDIVGAIQTLETYLESLSPGEPLYQTTLHQIGALSIQHDPRKAVAAYETLLVTEPQSLEAKFFLAQSIAPIGDYDRVLELYDELLLDDRLDQDTRLRVELHKAFGLAVKNRDLEAEELLTKLEPEVRADGSPYIEAKFYTQRGLVVERLDRIDEAEADLLAAAKLQIRYGFNTDLERVYNALGFIAQKRADRQFEFQRLYLEQAAEYFRKQYEVSLRIDKKRAIAAALYYQGDIEIQLNHFENAEKVLLHGLRVAREHSTPTYEFLAWLGLAELAAARGKLELSCEHLEQAEEIYAERGEFGIGPRTAGKIRALPCTSTVLDKAP